MAGRSTKVDYSEIEAEYVASDLSQRELARRYGLSNSTLSSYARQHDWDEKRRVFRMQVARRTTDRVADKISEIATEIEMERVTVLRATLRVYAEQLTTGKIVVSPRDIVGVSSELSRIIGGQAAGGSVANDGTIVVSEPVDEPLLRRLLEASREHVADPGGMGATPGDRAQGPRLN